MSQAVLVDPLDVLVLRGNRLFTGGVHGECVMPPWPSVFAGAFRSRILADAGVAFEDFRRGSVADRRVARIVGDGPGNPGTLRLCGVALAREGAGAVGEWQVLHPMPADLLWEHGSVHGPACARSLRPRTLTALGVRTSCRLERSPVLATDVPSKGSGRGWVTVDGLERHLAGEAPAERDVLPPASGGEGGPAPLWALEAKIGVAIDAERRTAREGLLYTTETVALGKGVSFVVAFEGADGLLPSTGLLRLGGDGRGASLRPLPRGVLYGPRFRDPGRRFRLILSTPGIFPGGWAPTSQEPGLGEVLRFDRFAAKLVCAAVPRFDVVSGWDLAEARPKPAVRVVPAGAVYWFETLEGSSTDLERLASEGLWPAIAERGGPLPGGRRQEGFNNVWIGTWNDDEISRRKA